MVLFFPVFPVSHLPVVVQVVEVLSDPRLGTLALDVPSGCCGAGGQAAQSGQTSEAESREPERQHGPGGAPDGGEAPDTLTRFYLL